MVEDSPEQYEVMLTPAFMEDLAACTSYIAIQLKSPLTARKTYEAIRDKVLSLSMLPQAATSYTSPTTGTMRYKISYKNYDIHYCIEGTTVRILGLKHQLQNDRQM